MENNINIELYAVRNKEGKYFRAKGISGYGESWVDDLNKAKIYTKLGQARSRVTYYSNNFPKYGFPDIIKLVVGEIVVISEEARVNKAIEKKKKAKIEQDKRAAKWRLEAAERDLARAQNALNSLKNK